MRQSLALLQLLFCPFFYAQSISGKVTAEDGTALPSVFVINMQSNAKSYTDAAGNFFISAKIGNEIRFVKEGYDRVAKKISAPEIGTSINIELRKSFIEIETVNIAANRQKIENLKNSIGLPQAPENAREKAPELKRDVLLPLLFASLNIDAVYKIASGDARRMKRAYAYDDLQSNTAKIRSALTDEYFISAGIPAEKINEFIAFSFSTNPEILQAVRVNNVTRAVLKFDALLPVYLQRLKISGQN